MRELSLNGYIDEESWFGDEITPDSLHELLYGKDNAATDEPKKNVVAADTASRGLSRARNRPRNGFFINASRLRA